MTVISNSTPLIYLAAIGQFDLLHDLYGSVHIPSAVYDEVVVQGAGRWGSAETAAANWIDRHIVTDVSEVAILRKQLHLGESEVIVLADELRANLVIADEAAARREIAQRRIGLIGTVGVLISAKLNGLSSALKPDLDQLRTCGFRLSDRLYRASLKAVGE
jgi:predicted nucleic acid-binding protein